MKNRRKYYYSVEFDGGISYVIAVSKRAALKQVKRVQHKRNYHMDTLMRISRAEYDAAHT